MARRFAIAVAVASAFVLAAPRVAHAEDFIFFDAHPVHPAAGGGFCEAAGAHVHDYAPVDPGAFVLRDGLWFFVGDPVVYGYRGAVYRFDGPHEIGGSEGVGVCSISGVHYHLYAPVVAMAPAPALFYAPMLGVSPWWWDAPVARPPRPEREHVYPVSPPRPPRVRPTPPPTTRAFPVPSSTGPRRVAPPPPARGR